MLLLVTILLVLIAAVTLLIGIFSDNLVLIFVSIGASALAAIVLGVLSQVSKRKSREAAAETTGPEPLPAREPATVGGGRADAEQAAADIATIGEPVGVAASSDAPTTTMSAVGGPLPIANYDSLRVNEILPALDDLDLDQLEAVAQHEEGNKNRTTVLNRIDDLMDELEAQESGGSTPVVDLTDDDEVAAAAVESIATVGEPVAAAASAPAAGGASSDGFPIADYDDLDEDELIELLQDLDADELEAVADREEAGQNRDAVLDAIDDRLDILEGIVPAPPAKAAAAPAPAKSAVATKAATKAPARKAPAKAAAAAKTAAKKATPPTATRKAAATPAKRTPAKAATSTARKAAAPAKKTATRSAAAAAKAPAKKATATTAKAAKTTKKAATTAKKAAPVKKATAAKKSAKR